MATENSTKIELKFNNKVNGEKKLERYEERLKSIYSLIGGLNGTETKETMQQISKNSEALNKNMKAMGTSANNLSKTFKTIFNVSKLVLFGRELFKLTKTFANLSQKSVEYIENVNLLQVAYYNVNETIEESSKRIQTYIDKMSEVYGFDESRLTRSFGIFKQLANAMQLPIETAENLSELMVKMSNDIASLYNLDLKRAENALQSALAGQVRPIRSATGADITEKTLQNTVDDLGLDRTINQLSYVEKRLVMVVSLTEQLKNSQGDYARTIESASNQIRVMKEQWSRLSRAVGNVFYPILEQVLPYVNAILMSLTEIFNLIASLVHFKMPDFNYEGLTGVSDVAMDIEDEMLGAGEATDELANKLKGLRGFDKLNVINTPTESKSSSAGAGVGSGYIDPKIMEAFNKAFSEYDDKMETVRMRALDIRDTIMEWLGFTKLVNEATGEISWKYEFANEKLNNLLKNLQTTGGNLISLFYTLGETIYNVLQSPIGNTMFDNLYQTINNIINSIGNISVALEEAFNKNDTGYKIFETVFGIINDILKITEKITRSLKKWTASKSFQDAIKAILGVLNDILKIAKDIVDWVVEMYDKYLEPIINNLLKLISEIINAIKPIWDIVQPIIKKIINIYIKFLEPILSSLLKIINDIIKTLTGLMEFVGGVFSGNWEKAWNGIKDTFSGVFKFIFDKGTEALSFFEGIWNGITEIFSGVGKWFKDIFEGAWNNIKKVFDNPGRFFKNVVDKIATAFSDGFAGIKETISNIWNDIIGLFSFGGNIFNGIVEGVADIFKKIVNGLINGINWIISKPFEIINDVLNGIHDFKLFGQKPFAGFWDYDPIPIPQIPNLAIGGMPKVGQLFVANEDGAELVGNIGGQSFVANQNQMMDLLDKKIGNAQNQQKQPQIYNIYLDAEHKIGTYTLDQLQDLAKTNGQAITIGG